MDSTLSIQVSAAALPAFALALEPGAHWETSVMKEWLQQRRELVEALGAELRAGFEAVAQFQAAAYLDCVERQEGLACRIAEHDRKMPLPDSDPDALRAAAAELGRMNAELGRLNDIHHALIEAGSRSVRTFQRVWALGAADYAADPAVKREPEFAPAPKEMKARKPGKRGGN